MEYTEQKHPLVPPHREKLLLTFLIALGCAAAMFVPFIVWGKGYFIFYGDFNVQQIPFYQTCHEAIRNGDWRWSWLTDLGSNFIGSYSFYLLGSPFFWLTIPFPNRFVPYLMGPLLILKFACAAASAYLYIRRFVRMPDTAMLGGLLYAFSGFSVYNIFFNHFHEAIIVFPLLLLSMELLLTENRRGVFAVMVALSAVVNYFFFFGMVVFSVIYFFVRLLSRSVSVSRSRFLVMLFEAVLGLCLSLFLLYPSLLAIAGNGRVSNIQLGWNAMMYGKEQIYLNVLECFFFPPDIPARPVFFPGANVKWSSLGGWLPLFSMVGVFTWFKTKTGSWQKRLLGVCIFMAMVPILNSAFYAFNASYYARWFYMPILIMCLVTVSLTEDSDADWSFGFKWVFWITAVTSLVIGLFPQKADENSDDITFGLYTKGSDETYLIRFWLTCAVALLSLVVLRVLLPLLRKNRKDFMKYAAVFTCVFSLIYGVIFLIEGRSHSYDPQSVMIDQLIEGEVALDDSENYRIDVYSGVDNTSMYLGYPGINAFHSIVPPSVMEFYEFVGEKRDVASRPETDNPCLRPLLSVKYLLNRVDGDSFLQDGTAKMPGYRYLKTENGYTIYENENYIPYGFSYDYYMTEEFCESYSAKSRAGLMLKAILLTDEQIERYGDLMTDLETLSDRVYAAGSAASLSLSDEATAYDCETLAQTAAYEFHRDTKGFTANVEREQDSLVFFSVPYDQGWSCTVNGEPAVIEKVNVGFMAVKVGSGTSSIRFTYTVPGLETGAFISLGAAGVLVLYLILCAAGKRRNAPKKTKERPVWDFDQPEEPSAKAPESDQNTTSKASGFEGGFQVFPSAFDDDPAPVPPADTNEGTEN